MNNTAKGLLVGALYSAGAIGLMVLEEKIYHWKVRKMKIKYIKQQQKYAVHNAEMILKGAR